MAAFTLRETERPVVLLSAGIGATPVVAMLQALSVRRDARPVWWLHGARDPEEHAVPRGGRAAARGAAGRTRLRLLQRAGLWRSPTGLTPGPAGSTGRRSRRPECRSTPTSTSADRPVSCAAWERPWRRGESCRTRSTRRTSGRRRPSTRASSRVARPLRILPTARPARAPWCCSDEATSTSRGTTATGASGTRRGLRRPGQLQLPDRCLRFVRERGALRIRGVHDRAAPDATRGARPAVLLAAGLGADPRAVISACRERDDLHNSRRGRAEG